MTKDVTMAVASETKAWAEQKRQQAEEFGFWTYTEDEWLDTARLKRGTDEYYAMSFAIEAAGGLRPDALSDKPEKLVLYWRGIIIADAAVRGEPVPPEFIIEADSYDWLTFKRALQFLDENSFGRSWLKEDLYVTDTRWPTIKKRLQAIGARRARMGRKIVIVSDTGLHPRLPDEYAHIIFYPGPEKATMAMVQKL